MISNKAKYAFRALLAIAAAPEGGAMTSAEIARRYAIPHKFLEQILLDLKKAGILDSRRGKSGGYVMLRPADTVSFGEVLRIFEGPLAPLPCLSRQSYRRCEDCVSEAVLYARRKMLLKFIAAALAMSSILPAAELSTRKILNLATIKTMVAAAEAETQKRGVQVTICIVDDSGNLLFLEKEDGAGFNTVLFAQKKARHSAFFKAPSKAAADAVKNGNTAILVMPNAFPNQGGLPIKVDGQTIGGIGVSGAASEVDEAIGQAALDAAFGKPQ